MDLMSLKKIGGYTEMCEWVAVSDDERQMVRNAKYWWARRMARFRTTIQPKLLSGATLTQEEIESNDKKFLRSLGISADEPNVDDGA